MTNAVPFERKTTLQLDTAVRSLSTLRKSVHDNDDGTESRTILADIQQAVRTFQDRSLYRVAAPDASLAFQPRVLLSLLVYCYLTGTFGSLDIEELMRADATFRNLCRDELPSARVIRRFRRENRSAIRECIFSVLCRQSQRYSQPGETGTSRWLETLMEEADGRILKAMFIDHMEEEI